MKKVFKNQYKTALAVFLTTLMIASGFGSALIADSDSNRDNEEKRITNIWNSSDDTTDKHADNIHQMHLNSFDSNYYYDSFTDASKWNCWWHVYIVEDPGNCFLQGGVGQKFGSATYNGYISCPGTIYKVIVECQGWNGGGIHSNSLTTVAITVDGGSTGQTVVSITTIGSYSVSETWNVPAGQQGSQLGITIGMSENNPLLHLMEWIRVTYYYNIPAPDLTVNDIWVDPSTFYPGDTVDLWSEIQNIGSGDCPDSFYVKMWFDGTSLGSALINGLNAGQKWYVYVSGYQWPNDCNPHTIKVEVDSTHIITETNEKNNIREKSFTAIDPTPGNPSNLNAYNPTSSSIHLSWTKGSGSDKTMIRRSTSGYPSSPSSGNQAYFGSGTSTTDTGLSSGQRYYYRAWAYDSDSGYYSDGYSSNNEYTKPGNPSNLDAHNPTETSIDLSWIKGYGGDKTMIRRKTGSYPSSPTDGSQTYFGSGTSTTDSGLSPDTTYYYRAWAYDSDSEYYSDGYSQDFERTGYNEPPNTPNPPKGQTNGWLDLYYEYIASTVDPNPGDSVYYKFDWGDGTYSNWLGPYGSGVTVTKSNNWSSDSTYNVRVKAKDQHDSESGWSDPLHVTINDPTTNRFAVFIGNEHYTNYPDVDFAINDANDVRTTLVNNGWDTSNIGLSTDATANTIQNQITWLRDSEGSDSISVFFYAGHGVQLTDDNGDETDGLDEAICGINCLLPNTGFIRDDWLRERFDEFEGDIIVILDCCNSGGTNRISGSDLIDQALAIATGLGDELQGTNREILCACAENEDSYGDATLQNGVWTYFIVDGWDGDCDTNGDGIFTGQETYDHADPECRNWQINNWGSVLQHPVMHDGYDGDLPIVYNGRCINHPPNVPSNPIPEDGATNVSTNTQLSVFLSDIDDDIMYVDFYWDNNTKIGTVYDVSSNSQALIDISGLLPSYTYKWYTNVSDGMNNTQSPIWEFTTGVYVNHPPNKPSDPDPQNNASDVSTNPILSVYVSDPDEDVMDVSFYDAYDSLIGTNTNVPSGYRASCSWPNRDPYTSYTWYAVADDGEYTNQSDTWEFTTGSESNDPPNTPSKPSGPQVTGVGTLYSYLTSTTDPDGHQVYYMWDWGDGTHSDWLGPYDSGEMASGNHSWSSMGIYQIKVKAKDDPNGDGDLSDGDESDWSDPLPILNPKNMIQLRIIQFFQSLIHRFPLLERIISLMPIFSKILNL